MALAPGRPDTERKPLPGHPARGAATGSGCASAFMMVFGLPFMGAGMMIALMALGKIPAKSSGGPLPPWLPWALAVIFFAPGLFLFLTGDSHVAARAGARGGSTSGMPREPWLAAGEWEAEGTTDRPERRSWRRSCGSRS